MIPGESWPILYSRVSAKLHKCTIGKCADHPSIVIFHATMEVYSRTTTLILFDIPSGAALTFDTFSFASTPSFRGIKYIPEGIHLFTYGLDKSELGIRSGF